MLKLLPLGAVLATIISTQIPALSSSQHLQLSQLPSYQPIVPSCTSATLFSLQILQVYINLLR